MKIQVETVSPVERKVSIEVDPERVAQELTKAYTSLGRRVKLRGFRPGKAPRKVLERNFKDQVEAEVLEKLVSDTFGEAVRDQAIDAVAPPHVSLDEGRIAEGQPVKYTAKVEVKPSIAPKDYKGLAVTRKPPEVTDQNVSDEIAKLQERFAELTPVEGRDVAQEGDFAVVDHEGTIDGQPFEGSKADGVVVKVSEGAIPDGNLGALAGKKVGDVIEIDEPFAADHRNASLRGKTAHMKVVLRALKTRKNPVLDDAFAKEIGIEGVETVDALRARIRADLEKREKRRAEHELKDNLVKAALEKNEFEVPPALVERAIDAMIEGAAERFARSGIDIRQLELDFARMRADLRDQALLQVRGALLLESIADAEKVDVTDEDLQAEMARVADEIGMPLSRVQQQMRGKDAREALKNRIREEKAVSILSSNATITP